MWAINGSCDGKDIAPRERAVTRDSTSNAIDKQKMNEDTVVEHTGGAIKIVILYCSTTVMYFYIREPTEKCSTSLRCGFRTSSNLKDGTKS